MKSLLLSTLFALLIIPSVAQITYSNLNRGLTRPERVSGLSINLNGPSLVGFIAQSAAFTKLRSVRIRGIEDPALLEEVFKALVKVPTLEELTFTWNDATRLPGNLAQLRTLKRINVIRSSVKSQYTKRTIKLDTEEGDLVAVFYEPPGGSNYEDVLQNYFAAGELFPDASLRPIPKRWINVTPPIKGVAVPTICFQMDPAQTSVINAPSGTRITIPANSIVDAQGNAITTPVQVDYREFRDPVDILVSGIPMKYDSGGVASDFQSAGMFELTATSQGREVFLANDQSMSVAFASVTDGAYNLYQYNDATANWTNEGDAPLAPNQKVEAPEGQMLSASWRVYLYAKRENPRWRFCQYTDSLSLDARFADRNYRNVFNTQGCTVWTDRRYRAIDKKERYVTLSRYKGKRPKGEVWFTVSTVNRVFPEMMALNRKVWVYAGTGKNRSFRGEFTKKMRYSDIRLEFDAGTGMYTMLLKDQGGDIVTLQAYPRERALTDEALERSLEMGAKWYERYERTLNRKRIQFARGIKREQRKYLQRNNLDRVEVQAWSTRPDSMAWVQARGSMSEPELAMSYYEWKAYFDGLDREQFVFISGRSMQGRATLGSQMRRLALGGFGIWNCDRMLRFRDPVAIEPQILARNMPKSPVLGYYVLYTEDNAVLYYEAENLQISTGSPATLMAVTEEGDLMVCDTDDIPNLTELQPGPLDLPVRTLPNCSTLDEFKLRMRLW